MKWGADAGEVISSPFPRGWDVDRLVSVRTTIGPRNIRMEAVLENAALAHIYPLFSWAFGPQIHPFSGTASWDPQNLSTFL